jgi:cell division protein ZapD
MRNLHLYEFPFNDKMRVFMRLEAYFAQMEYHMQHLNKWDLQACMTTIMEIFTIIERNDLKTLFNKELERYYANLSAYIEIPSINTHKLTSILAEIEEAIQLLINSSNKISRDLLEKDNLLNYTRQKMLSSSSINSFDIPSYYHWLHQPALVCEQKIGEWMKYLAPIKVCVRLVLEITRESSIFESKLSANGFYQQTLSPQSSCQLIRVQIEEACGYFPEVSGSKHRVNIRFLTYLNAHEKPVQSEKEVHFEVSTCCT